MMACLLVVAVVAVAIMARNQAAGTSAVLQALGNAQGPTQATHATRALDATGGLASASGFGPHDDPWAAPKRRATPPPSEDDAPEPSKRRQSEEEASDERHREEEKRAPQPLVAGFERFGALTLTEPRAAPKNLPPRRTA